MDRKWMKQPRTSDVYDDGVTEFLNFAFENASAEGKISCPCKKCKLLSRVTREDGYDHLIVNGFLEEYTTWVFHGELKSSRRTSDDVSSNKTSDMNIDVDDFLHETFGYNDDSHYNGDGINAETEHPPHDRAEEFYKFVDDAKKELYPGCKNFTKLEFVIRLFQIKCLGGWSNNSFTMLLKLLKDALPEGDLLPNSYYEMKKIISKYGLGYEKIHACPNDCILYRKEYQDMDECPKCHISRYKVPENDSSTSSVPTAGNSKISAKVSKIPAKVLRYFPLTPRLKRLYMCSETAPLMRWHEDERTKDGYMRHPADSPAWKTFDYNNPDFALEARNARLGLASDGMNPFRTMSTSYSIWPVVLTVYNLPPWMCMRADNLILSLIIPGPDSPGQNIDIYLQPLVDELKLLWETGVQTYDISSKMNFNLRAALLWTISDLPALAYLSGWSTSGKYGCICCHKETCSTWLKYSHKFSYTGHRRFLDKKHGFRNEQKSFDGTKEKRAAPVPLDGNEILKILEGFEIEFGKTSTNPTLPYNWKKLSIFFQLPYWKYNLIRHCLDMMHIEKNVCESFIGTLLELEGKMRDGLKARLDLQLMGLKPELHPKEGPNNKTIIPPSCLSLKKEEKLKFCKFLKRIKVPDAYASNISRGVKVKEKKIFGLKSHDCHILIQQLLPLATRGILSSNIYSCVVELSNFFREMYSKVKRPEDFAKLEKEITITLCKLEKIVPPSFFNITVHLLIHLPREARLAGPVQYREMYPIEKYLCRLKSYVKNKNQPEGCIAEGYLADECLTFCSRYTKGVETRLSQPSRNNDEDDIIENVLPIFSMPGRSLGKGHIDVMDDSVRAMAHQYVLFNSDDVEIYKEEHLNFIPQQHPHLNDWHKEKIHTKEFSTWFGNKASTLSNDLKSLAHGPQRVCTRYKKYIMNGFRFHTKEVEAMRKTQNSGVSVTAQTKRENSTMDNDMDIQFGLNAAIVDAHGNENLEQHGGEQNVVRRTRGPTQMRRVWGRRESEPRLEVGVNDFGQPDDEMAPSFSNFIGSLMRDGNYAPLSYLSWRKVPEDTKETLWNMLQEYYNIPLSAKTWTLQKFGKQLKNWRSRLKKKCYKPGMTYEQLRELKDQRVTDENFRHLVDYWNTDRAKQVSAKNKIARSHRTLNHTTCTKSFASVLKEQTKKLDRVPRQSEFFKHCYSKKDGTEADIVRTTIDKISEKENENENSNMATEFRSFNDSYAQVMGQDKNGKVRMLGAGVCPSMVFDNISNRGANQMKLIMKLQEQNNQLRSENNQLRLNVANDPSNESINADQDDEDLTPILQVAGRQDWLLTRSSNLNSNGGSIKIGDSIFLKSIIRPSETIAVGLLYSTDPSKEVGNQDLCPDHWEVYIEVSVKPQERLVRACGQYQNIGQAVGDYIAWPKAYIEKKDN